MSQDPLYCMASVLPSELCTWNQGQNLAPACANDGATSATNIETPVSAASNVHVFWALESFECMDEHTAMTWLPNLRAGLRNSWKYLDMYCYELMTWCPYAASTFLPKIGANLLQVSELQSQKNKQTTKSMERSLQKTQKKTEAEGEENKNKWSKECHVRLKTLKETDKEIQHYGR